MEVLDSALHIWNRGHPRPTTADNAQARRGGIPRVGRPYFNGSEPVTAEIMLHAMNEVGVDGAILVTPRIYALEESQRNGFDDRYSLAAAARYPDRFRVVGRLGPFAPDIDDQVAAWKAEPYGVGLRVTGNTTERLGADRAGMDAETRALLHEPFLNAVERYDVPLCVVCPNYLDLVIPPMAERHPELQIVLDHFGMWHELIPGVDAFEGLPKLLKLARYPNVAVKLTGLPALSREGPPFRDLWPPLHQALDAFGPQRLMWGSDATRCAHLVGYDEMVRYFTETMEISAAEKELMLARVLRRIFRWPASEVMPNQR